jgi:hypothetical protein
MLAGTEAHHQRSKGDPAYSAATATGKNEGPASGQARGQDFGAATPQPAAAAGTPSICVTTYA